jgi:hypothetical protein
MYFAAANIIFNLKEFITVTKLSFVYI